MSLCGIYISYMMNEDTLRHLRLLYVSHTSPIRLLYVYNDTVRHICLLYVSYTSPIRLLYVSHTSPTR